MKNVRVIIIITCLALMGAMQVKAATFKPYKPQRQTQYSQPMYHMVTTTPSAIFQSTSSMQSSGSIYTTTPALNENGTVNEEAYGVGQSGPRKAKKDGDGGLVPPDDPDAPIYVDPENPAQENPNGFPLGDAVLPLLLMSLMFGMFVYFRRKQTLNG